MRIDQFLWGISAITLASGLTVAFAVYFGLYTGDTDADLHHFGREHVVPCSIISAVKSELLHVDPRCNSTHPTSQCFDMVLQLEVRYETTSSEVRHINLHYDIHQDDEGACSTLNSCLQHFGLKYGENDCYYGAGSKSQQNSGDGDGEDIDGGWQHLDDAEQEIFLQPDHPHNIMPMILFVITMILTLVPCCFLGGVIVALAAVFDMDVNILRGMRCDVGSIIEQKAGHLNPYAASLSLSSSQDAVDKLK
eukprot:TRINITY_DN11992_c0_g1_i1.p1 TRINITY_DN11992_c0_g1~~TRINITY_DN11992_c0_g1_i1.p1  ORF type:complete len:250 (-),score=49.92 TRINITY_DN11992_c0_g1_i1:182-931(-)